MDDNMSNTTNLQLLKWSNHQQSNTHLIINGLEGARNMMHPCYAGEHMIWQHANNKSRFTLMVKLACKSFENYVDLFEDDKKTRAYERFNRWEVVVGVNPFQQFEQVS